MLRSQDMSPYVVQSGMTDHALQSTLRMAENGKSVAKIMDNPQSVSEFAVYNPANVRSRFAAFDPMRRHEADLLGNIDPRLLTAIGIGSVGAAYGATQLPEEYKSAIGAAFGGN